MPGAMGLAAGWRRTSVAANDPTGIARIVIEEAELALNDEAPILLFPFGPKAHVFVAAFHLALTYGAASWCVYPVPVAYNVDYTQGSAATSWMRVM